MTSRRENAFLAALTSLSVGGAASAQCDGNWQPSIEANSVVEAMALWDPDGLGPRGEVLVVGGSFTSIAGVEAHKLAVLDGAVWRPLATPAAMAAVTSISALAVLNGELIVAGDFEVIDGGPIRGIAAWNGQNWRPLDHGFPPVHISPGGLAYRVSPIDAMVVYDGRLIVGGRLIFGDFEEFAGLAGWDGQRWAALPGAGIDAFGTVLELTVYRDEIIAAGSLWKMSGEPVDSIAAFNGSSWRQLGAGLNDVRITALVEHDGDLVAGGLLQHPQRSYLARWDGASWTEMTPPSIRPAISSLAVYHDRLIVGKSSWNPQNPLELMAQWDGSSWSPLDDGPPGAWESIWVSAMMPYRDELIVGVSKTSSPYRSSVAIWSEPTADFLTDGVIDWSDYIEFLTLFDGEHSAADLTRDGAVDFADYLKFLDLFAAGC